MQVHESKTDQATGLRRLGAVRPVKVIAVSGGKGGVGKTNVSVNLALALSQLERKVMLLDADFGLANVDVLLGLSPEYDLSHLVRGERTLEEILVDGPGGVQIIPASSGLGHMAALTPAEHAGVIRAFSDLGQALDVLVIDTAAGISDAVVSFCRAAQEVIVVVCDEPASITDAYAFMKVMNREHGQERFHVLANMARSAAEGHELYLKLTRAAERFLEITPLFLGAVPHDERLRRAVQKQQAVVEAYPNSPSATAFRKIARAIDRWPLPTRPGGQLEFFVERLIGADLHYAEVS